MLLYEVIQLFTPDNVEPETVVSQLQKWKDSAEIGLVFQGAAPFLYNQ